MLTPSDFEIVQLGANAYYYKSSKLPSHLVFVSPMKDNGGQRVQIKDRRAKILEDLEFPKATMEEALKHCQQLFFMYSSESGV